MSVPVSHYPFPHASEEELAAHAAALGGLDDAKDYLIQHLGPHLPELWPGGVPEGLPLLPTSSTETLFPDAPESPDSETPRATPVEISADSPEAPPAIETASP